MGKFFFSWVGQNETLCVPKVFKTFKRIKINCVTSLHEKEKKHL